MDSLYNKKYLKYRSKYVALKNQIGGTKCERCGYESPNCLCNFRIPTLPDLPLDIIISGLDLNALISFAQSDPGMLEYINRRFGKILENIKRYYPKDITLIDSFFAVIREHPEFNNIRYLIMAKDVLSKKIEPEYIPRMIQLAIDTYNDPEARRLLTFSLENYYTEYTYNLIMILDLVRNNNAAIINAIIDKIRENVNSAEAAKFIANINQNAKKILSDKDSLRLIFHLLDYYTTELDDYEFNYQGEKRGPLSTLMLIIRGLAPYEIKSLLIIFSNSEIHNNNINYIRDFLNKLNRARLDPMHYAKMAQHFSNGNMTNVLELFNYIEYAKRRYLFEADIDKMFEQFKNKPFVLQTVAEASYKW
jgi:hypothetical protein